MSQHRDELRALHERYRAIADVDRDALPSLWAAVLLRMRDDGMIRGHGSVPGELAESRPPQRALREGHSACCSGSNRRRHHFPSSSSNPATAALGAAVGLCRARNDRPSKPIGELLDAIAAGRTYRFRLLANPTRKIARFDAARLLRALSPGDRRR